MDERCKVFIHENHYVFFNYLFHLYRYKRIMLIHKIVIENNGDFDNHKRMKVIK